VIIYVVLQDQQRKQIGVEKLEIVEIPINETAGVLQSKVPRTVAGNTVLSTHKLVLLAVFMVGEEGTSCIVITFVLILHRDW
jgi:hypothetical protein